MNRPKIIEILSALGVDIRQSPPKTELLQRIEQLLLQYPDSPPTLIAEVLRAELRADDEKRRGDANEQSCLKAMEAVESVNELVHDMVNGASDFMRLLAVRHTEDGPRAVCQAGIRIQELEIHPEVDLEELEQLQ